MTTPDTRDPARRELGLRVTSEQVDDILQWIGDDVDAETLEAICRDWLDMEAQEGRMRAVIAAAREYVAFCETDEIGTTTLEGGLLLHALCNALAALTTGGGA